MSAARFLGPAQVALGDPGYAVADEELDVETGAGRLPTYVAAEEARRATGAGTRLTVVESSEVVSGLAT
jgi:hypothetical protein